MGKSMYLFIKSEPSKSIDRNGVLACFSISETLAGGSCNPGASTCATGLSCINYICQKSELH